MSFLLDQNLSVEGRQTLRLALPLIVGQVSQMLTVVADTLMIGRLGSVPLATATFANTVLQVPFIFGIGMVVAVSIRVSQARGAKAPAAARAALRHGLYISFALGFLTLAAAWLMLPALPVFQQKPEVISEIPDYFLWVAASLIPAFASLAMKHHADAMNHPWPPFWILLGGVLLNIGLNWIFIYGNWGAPRMELAGAGLATFLARSLTFIMMWVWVERFATFREWIPRHWLRRPDWPAVTHLVKIGFPASIQILAESSAFVFATLMIGTLGPDALAAHQVAISCAGTVFMVPLGLSQALTVRIGEAWGAQDFHRLRPIAISGWILAAGFALCSALIFWFFNQPLAAAFLKEASTLHLAAGLLGVAAFFQLGDALQIVSAGSLRGMDDVAVPAWLTFSAFWLVALPMGWFLTFRGGMGVVGMWWGITLGLSLTALALGVRLWLKSSGRQPGKQEVASGDLSSTEPSTG